MNSFWKIFLASLLAIFVGIILFFFVSIGFLSSLASFAESTPQVADNSVLTLKLNNRIVDRKSNNPFEDMDIPFPGVSTSPTTGLNQILRSIKKAKTDDHIKGIYLNLSDIGAGYATIEEIRDALKDFKSSDKFIYAYSDNISQKAYYLATVADSLIMNPRGMFDFRGLTAQRTFYKKAMDKFGIDMQIIRGRNNKFKSAVEPFMYEKMSEANREQTKVYLHSIWNHLLQGISETRNISIDSLQAYANEVQTFRMPQKALSEGFFDNLKYKDQVLADLRSLTGVSENKDIPSIGPGKYDKVPEKHDGKGLAKNKIAVIYAQGEIDPGSDGSYYIDSRKISQTIRKARQDSTIKAVVFRVNSPGGSAYGSEVIWREVELTQKVKPVVVSMGDLAASGGYYISCAAGTIMAEPTTITGSIGIFGMIPNFHDLLSNKIGITFDEVNTNAHSGMPTVSRAMTPFEHDLMQNYVEKGYELFLKRVATGRDTTSHYIDGIGQGRVWTGENGKQIGLVDKFGGLNDAIKLAASQAGVENYRIKELPKEKDPFEELLKNFSTAAKVKMSEYVLGDSYKTWENINRVSHMNGLYTMLPYTLEIR
ncbi:signal peptide peptidase SppA [Prolixibacter bellariivorans]|uniref:Signal peptide peptidase SppA n=1 Tax=Prolixibacter bellariivorans TaxID=314319 RepID=A0A5M4AX51_9BACT|nr:signal peptide peptidase SppA [Prolixibacter bellariivorans]GET32489.1 signal peptide peptidase SppA [Prolixibacter bellariivorans]